MTLELAPVTGTHWMSPEHGLWVASRHGEFLGMIERTEGRYRASDSRGRARGTFEGLAEAQFAVDREKTERNEDRERVLLRATIVLTGITTLGLAYGIFQLAS